MTSPVYPMASGAHSFLAVRPGVRAAELSDQFLTVPAEGYAACCEAIAAMDLRPVRWSSSPAHIWRPPNTRTPWPPP